VSVKSNVCSCVDVPLLLAPVNTFVQIEPSLETCRSNSAWRLLPR
jgi:hypothetical protein